MLMNLAELAAYVRDVKPESDVHSNLPNHSGKNNGFNAAVFTIVVIQFRPMRLPLMRNQLPTTSTPHLYKNKCVCRLCGTNS